MIKRVDLERHLKANGAKKIREGGRHTMWIATSATRPVPVARHREIPPTTAREICKQLGVPPL